MKSADNGNSFFETGRCQLEQGSFCNVGFPDGSIIGFDVPRINEAGTGWCDYIEVRESKDGGTSWTQVNRILEGCAPYLWRARRLRDSTIIFCASLYGTPWGEGQQRTTRNTMLPGESYLNKIQTFFLTSKDGKTFSEPHYILPGTGAHEFDFVELEDGSLLFIAGDVQATPVARQIVKRTKDGFINGTLYSIRQGAPENPATDPQSGYVPEAMVLTKDGMIVGSRRNKPYSASNDLGENWFEIADLPPSLYQPYMMLLPDGSIANFGHFGGDAAFGQEDMFIGGDFFHITNALPPSGTLHLSRLLDNSGSHYLNAFSACFEAGGAPLANLPLIFRFTPVWNEDGSVNSTKQENAPIQICGMTNENGIATVDVSDYFDRIGDIHFYYQVDVVYQASVKDGPLPCDGPSMCVAALTPYRRRRYPYPAYFAEGVLFLSPALIEAFPNALSALNEEAKKGRGFFQKGLFEPRLVDLLIESGVLHAIGENYYWLKSVHAPKPLTRVLPMAEGDWYE